MVMRKLFIRPSDCACLAGPITAQGGRQVGCPLSPGAGRWSTVAHRHVGDRCLPASHHGSWPSDNLHSPGDAHL